MAGAGPAGILAAIHLLRRNERTEGTGVRYNVTLVDGRQDYGKLSLEDLKSSHRSWMLALAGHGLEAVRKVPELYDDYVHRVGIQIESVSIHLGAKEIRNQADAENEQGEAYVVDRNFVVAALARFLNDKFGDDESFRARYSQKLLYVDGENKRVLVRTADGGEEYLEYDLLLGCDGVRSTVREALIKRHSDFECDVGDIFQQFKAVHVKRPDSVHPGSMHLLPACFENFQGIGLPETDGMLCMSIGTARHTLEAAPEELRSSDPKVVAKFVKENFKAWELVDYDDFARQWCAQNWNRTGQVHCSSYHSLPLGIVIMGDAAHATSPSIGMGMNTALADATALDDLLDEHEDELEKVLVAFSEERVKVGNSLTDLAMHLYCLSSWHQAIETIHTIARGVLSKILPSLVTVHPQSIIGRTRYSLADVYDIATRLGIIQKHRAINNRIRREYFEKKVGMVKPRKSSAIRTAMKLGAFGAALAAAWFAYQ